MNPETSTRETVQTRIWVQAIERLCLLGYGEDAAVLLRSNVNLLANVAYIVTDEQPNERAAEYMRMRGCGSGRSCETRTAKKSGPPIFPFRLTNSPNCLSDGGRSRLRRAPNAFQRTTTRLDIGSTLVLNTRTRSPSPVTLATAMRPRPSRGSSQGRAIHMSK